MSETPGAAASAIFSTGILFETVRIGNTECRYAVYIPRDYTPDRQWPVIVFLNGRGECGMDGQKQLAVGLIPAVLLDADAWPFIIVCPQKPDYESEWAAHEDLVFAALDQTLAAYSGDRSRVYLTGLSQGGRGTWQIAAAHPDRFAAIAPICGWGDPKDLAPKLKGTPVWAFHGEKDDVVDPKGTKDLVAALKEEGAEARITLYPDANHNCWDHAYRQERLGHWLLEHRLSR